MFGFDGDVACLTHYESPETMETVYISQRN